MGKASDREKEKEKRRQERRERRKAANKHLFSDPTYDESKSKVFNDLDNALQEGKLFLVYQCIV